MNNEIKEILEETRRLIDNSEYKTHYHYCIHYEVEYLDKLLDYIINLQEDLKYQKEMEEEYNKKHTKLMQNYSKLQEENERLRKDYGCLMQDNAYTLKLEQRIDKALEELKKAHADHNGIRLCEIIGNAIFILEGEDTKESEEK